MPTRLRPSISPNADRTHTLGPRQLVNLFILTRDRMYWHYISYTIYGNLAMLGYFSFLLYLMFVSLRTVRVRTICHGPSACTLVEPPRGALRSRR